MARIKGGLEQMKAKTRQIMDISGAVESEIVRMIDADRGGKMEAETKGLK